MNNALAGAILEGMKHACHTLALATALGLASVAAQAQQAPSLDYIVDNDARTEYFADLTDGVGLDCAMEKDGPYTLFAPTDEGFDLLPDDAIDDYFEEKNRDLTRAMLTYHMVEGTYTSEDLRAAIEANGGEAIALPTVQGAYLEVIYGDDRLRITDGLGNTLVVSEPNTDIEASNGVVHYVVGVLMPPAEEVFADSARDCDPPTQRSGGRSMINADGDK